MNIKKLCPRCMLERINESGICDKCGFNESEYEPDDEALKIDTILSGRYLVGMVLGKGGFGITYIGMDLNLEMKVAIKELYPARQVYRNTQQMAIVENSTYRNTFEKMQEEFLKEARTLALFEENNSIVSVKDYFQENGTAYIVMEYLSGESLWNLVRDKGKQSPDYVLKMFNPIIKAMANLHDEGLIHRDISPANIIITERGDVKLIDFGTVHEENAIADVTYIKRGFSPIEQYKKNNYGPETDVYALCATMYYVMTGEIPQESIAREKNDELPQIGDIVPELTELESMAIMNGLSVDRQFRIKSARDLFYFLYLYDKAKESNPDKMEAMIHSKDIEKIVKEKRSSIGYKKRIAILTGVLVVIITVIGLLRIYGNLKKTVGVLPADTQQITQINEGNVNEDVDSLGRELEDYVLKKRQESGLSTLSVDNGTKEIANEFADSVSAMTAGEKFSQYCENIAADLSEKHKDAPMAWMALKESSNVSVSKVYEDIVSNASNKNELEGDNHSTIGISVMKGQNGVNYWIIILV